MLAALLAPGLWLRDSARNPDLAFDIVPLRFEAQVVGPFVLSGWWDLRGRDRRFGGLSALVAKGEGAFLAASDTGRFAAFDVPVDGRGEGRLQLAGKRTRSKLGADIEALAQDPDTGTLWAAYEHTNRIARFAPDYMKQANVSIEAMSGWGSNSGPESLLRLPDGRFVAIEESARGRGGVTHRAVLFSDDPTQDADVRTLHIETIDDYRVVDAAMLEGEIWLLLRDVRFGLPPRFASALARFPVAAVDKGSDISPELVVEFGDRIPRDNYEGLAIEKRADGTARFWIVSDDNFSSFQSSWLVALDYEP